MSAKKTKEVKRTEGANPEPLEMAARRAAGQTVFGTTAAEELELYRVWANNYPANRSAGNER
jgi:hypothetical protein